MKNILLLVVVVLLFSANKLCAQTGDIATLRSQAMNGDVEAMYRLSIAYKEVGNSKMSELWYNKALESGSKSAKRQEAMKMPFKQIYQLAQNGDAYAMMTLAAIYDQGSSEIIHDSSEALKWYRKALAIDEAMCLDELEIVGDASQQIAEEYANKGNQKFIKALCDYFNNRFWEGQLVDSDGTFNEANKKDGDMAIAYYQKAASLGDADAQAKAEKIKSFYKSKADEVASAKESEKAEYQRYKETLRNFAGTWYSKGWRTLQFKFDSNGKGWIRASASYDWASISVTYKSYNCISVYDGSGRYTLKVSGNKLTMGELVFWRK